MTGIKREIVVVELLKGRIPSFKNAVLKHRKLMKNNMMTNS